MSYFLYGGAADRVCCSEEECMFQLNRRSPVKDFIMIVIGTILVGIAAKNIYDPTSLVIGGFSGLGIILKQLLKIPLWMTNLFLNLPLFVLGVWFKGWKFVARTAFATALLTLVLMVLPEGALVPAGDLFLAAVFGGILTGAGCGLIFAARATSGGTDLMAALIQLLYRHYSLPQITQMLDYGIVLIGIGVFGMEKALYAIVSIYVMMKVSNGIIDGMHFAKAAYVVTTKPEIIAKGIMEQLDRGVTGIHAIGMYSGTDTTMLYCVLSSREVTLLKDIVSDVDPRAFVIVSDVREVLGEGFTR